MSSSTYSDSPRRIRQAGDPILAAAVLPTRLDRGRSRDRRVIDEKHFQPWVRTDGWFTVKGLQAFRRTNDWLDERPAAAFLFVVVFVAAFSLLVLDDRTFEAVASGLAAGVGLLIGMRIFE